MDEYLMVFRFPSDRDFTTFREELCGKFVGSVAVRSAVYSDGVVSCQATIPWRGLGAETHAMAVRHNGKRYLS